MSNGTNGDRIAKLCKASKIKNIVIPVDKKSLEETLKKNQDIAGVLVVHCEASTGLINPVKEIGEIVKQSSKGKMSMKEFVQNKAQEFHFSTNNQNT